MLKKKIFLVILIVILAILLFLQFYQTNSHKEEQLNNYQLTKNEISLLKEGDIILRHGFGVISDMIVNIDKSPYAVSHCGIICRDSNQRWKVIHTVSNSLSDIDGIQAEPLSMFVKNSKPNSLVIVRYKNTHDSTSKQLTDQAFFYLRKKVPFDDRFDTKDTSELYCTEFIRQLFLDVYKTDIYDTWQEDILGFQVFWEDKKFEIILSHQVPNKEKTKK